MRETEKSREYCAIWRKNGRKRDNFFANLISADIIALSEMTSCTPSALAANGALSKLGRRSQKRDEDGIAHFSRDLRNATTKT
ncbi:hypothetical protein LOC68_09110 [Blastopirellula sp. JC732]|uniref:Uncharacterized protein n=1 Tax=Blastopirellula sediminis TaxID=2894196 RepID=A0A9X1MKT6_9BACT|nr:hypothetical protein [Blastopirellula sediminis]MCC9608669.1 hypothetical protein [Blastopirellula sediminis]MCC9628554.1 hypothetical protein [Blastopirellula sediminis]